MFDRSKLNKSKFDKVKVPGIDLSFYGDGYIGGYPVVYMPLPGPSIFADGGIDIVPYIPTSPNMDVTENEGNVEAEIVLILELNIDMSGTGGVEIFRLGDTDISVIHLENIELQPGESLIIDTELMIVLFGVIHDVSSLTNKSKFFQLGKGLNELSFEATYTSAPSPRANDELNVVTIWENRFL